jgi:hypothetical protein
MLRPLESYSGQDSPENHQTATGCDGFSANMFLWRFWKAWEFKVDESGDVHISKIKGELPAISWSSNVLDS